MGEGILKLSQENSGASSARSISRKDAVAEGGVRRETGWPLSLLHYEDSDIEQQWAGVRNEKRKRKRPEA